MKYISIDGDDVGQKITSSYLRNDLSELSAINEMVNKKTKLIADFLRNQGFIIIFCAADGVAAYQQDNSSEDNFIFDSIASIAGKEMSFSIGVGSNLRESYIALLLAKSKGKARLCNFSVLN